MQIKVEKDEVAEVISWVFGSPDSPFYLGIGAMQVESIKMTAQGGVNLTLRKPEGALSFGSPPDEEGLDGEESEEEEE